MKIEQIEDKGLSHFSYAILSEDQKKIILIDPARNIRPYLEYAERNQAVIEAVIETHPHADFVSGHLELHEQHGALIYCSKLVGANYPHTSFDEGDQLQVGEIMLKPLNTPGHSPDSICIVLKHEGEEIAVFTGDTLFIGDCGRPDLREKVGSIKAGREALAKQMYNSLRAKLSVLADSTLVYPAHGAGTLCGKALSKLNRSTIGAEKRSNWAMGRMTESEFVAALTSEQPFVPIYFPYAVEANKTGAPSLESAIAKIQILKKITDLMLEKDIPVIDTRPASAFRKGHLPHSINLMQGEKFETWLGSILSPGEAFYLSAETEQVLNELIYCCAKIGYEGFIKAAFVWQGGAEQSHEFDTDKFKKSPESFTIVDIRNYGEVKEHPVFPTSINIPLGELRGRMQEIPTDKPIVVHCAAGYRSAAGASLVEYARPNQLVYNLGSDIISFMPQA